MNDRKPTAADRHVSRKMRERRKELGCTLEKMAADLRTTWQMVQKYERADTRISAGKLWQIAAVLQVDVGYFFAGLSAAPAQGSQPTAAHTTQTASAPQSLPPQ